MKTASFRLIRRTCCATALGTLLGACMSSSPYWDAHFGEAARASFAAQVIHPEAGQHPPSHPTYDGKAAVAAMNSYDKSIATGNAANANTGTTTGLSSMSGGMGGISTAGSSQ